MNECVCVRVYKYIYILLGWLIVWKMCLIRFPLIQELVYGTSTSSSSKDKHIVLKSYSRLRSHEAND